MAEQKSSLAINIPNHKPALDQPSSPCLPKTPPPTPEISNMKPEVTNKKPEVTEAPPALRKIPDPPSYVTASFIETALGTKHPGIKVTNLNIIPAVSVGENYICNVYRADVGTNQGPFALILKCLSENRADFVADSGLTKREMDIYNETLPILCEGLDETNEHRPNTVLCYYTIYEDTKDALVFQDMRPHGYRTTDRKAGLNYEQCKCAMEQLAKFHALSVKLRMKKPDLFQTEIVTKYEEAMYKEKNRNIFCIFLKASISNICQGVRDYFPYRYHALVDIMDSPTMIDNYFDMMVDLLTVTDSDRVLVLNHGDYWSNNILFQFENKDSDVPITCCMIDFQITRVGSPVLDLWYFFFSSTVKAIRDQHMEDLLHIYFNTVYDTLKHFNISAPLPKHMFYHSLEELRADLIKHEMFGFISGTLIMPVVVANAEDAPEMDKFDENTIEEDMSAYTILYTNPIFKRRFREILEDLDNSGFFVRTKKLLDELEEQKKQNHTS